MEAILKTFDDSLSEEELRNVEKAAEKMNDRED